MKKMRRTTIVQPAGEPVPGLPFQGETMTCVVCGRSLESSPDVSSHWRCIVVDNVRYYACVDEFPEDGADKKAFKASYLRILKKIFNERSK